MGSKIQTRRSADPLIVAASMILLVFVVFAPKYVLASDECPALPNAQGTFEGALRTLLNKFTGRPSRLSDMGDPVKELNAQQTQKVLGWLRAELAERRAVLASDRAGSKEAERLESLKRRIGVRDRIERDSILRRQREFDRGADGKVLLSSRKAKSLGQIIDEELAKENPSLASKYSKKYSSAVLKAIEEDPAKMGETAGALVAGDYSTVMDQAADWGAAGFGTIVSDVLEEMGHRGSKVLWDKAVTKAGTVKQVLIALKDGKHDEAWNAIVKDYKDEIKNQVRNVAKSAINWVFDAGSGTATIGDFVPGSSTAKITLAPSLFGLTPGDIYLKIIDAEVALIVFGKKQLYKRYDGRCVEIYKKTYNETGGSIDSAYKEFDHCIASYSRYSTLFEFGNKAKDVGMDKDAALRAFLEANRRGLPFSSTPLDWIKAQLARQKQDLQRKMLPELTRTEKVMANIATHVGAALDNRLMDLAVSALNEEQWDKLGEEIRQLEKVLDRTLAHVQHDLKRIKKYSDAIGQSCKTYEQNKKIAYAALEERDSIDNSLHLQDRLFDINTKACTPANASEEQKVLLANMNKGLVTLQGKVLEVCQLPDAVKSAENMETARAILANGLVMARSANALADKLLTGLSANQKTPREKIKTELAAIKNEIDTLESQFISLRNTRFNPARDAMRGAWKKISGLEHGVAPIIERVRTCLRPLAEAPIGRAPRQLLKELEEFSNDNVQCKLDIEETWNKKHKNIRDQFVPAWQSRQLDLTIPITTLRDRLSELEAKCSISDTDINGKIEAIGEQVEHSILRMQRCVALAKQGGKLDFTELKNAVNAAVGTCRSVQSEIDRGKQSANSAAKTGMQLGISLTEFERKVSLIKVDIDACKQAPNIRLEAAKGFGKTAEWANRAIQGYRAALSRAELRCTSTAKNEQDRLVKLADKLEHQAKYKNAITLNLLAKLKKTKEKGNRARAGINNLANLLNRIDIQRRTVRNHIDNANASVSTVRKRVAKCRSQRKAVSALAAPLKTIDAEAVNRVTAPLDAIRDLTGDAENMEGTLKGIYGEAKETMQSAKTIGAKAPRAGDLRECMAVEEPFSEKLAAWEAVLKLDEMGDVSIKVHGRQRECEKRNSARRKAEEEKRKKAEQEAAEARQRAAQQQAARSHGGGADCTGRGCYDWGGDGGNLDEGRTAGRTPMLPIGASGGGDALPQNVASSGTPIGGGYTDDPSERVEEERRRAEAAATIAAAANPESKYDEDQKEDVEGDEIDRVDLGTISNRGASRTQDDKDHGDDKGSVDSRDSGNTPGGATPGDPLPPATGAGSAGCQTAANALLVVMRQVPQIKDKSVCSTLPAWDRKVYRAADEYEKRCGKPFHNSEILLKQAKQFGAICGKGEPEKNRARGGQSRCSTLPNTTQIQNANECSISQAFWGSDGASHCLTVEEQNKLRAKKGTSVTCSGNCTKYPEGFSKQNYKGSIMCVKCPKGKKYRNNCCE